MSQQRPSSLSSPGTNTNTNTETDGIDTPIASTNPPQTAASTNTANTSASTSTAPARDRAVPSRITPVPPPPPPPTPGQRLHTVTESDVVGRHELTEDQQAEMARVPCDASMFTGWTHGRVTLLVSYRVPSQVEAEARNLFLCEECAERFLTSHVLVVYV